MCAKRAEGFPTQGRKPPLFFSRKSFFHLSVINVRPPHLAGPPPPTRGVPAPTPDLGQSRSRIVIEPASVPEAAAKPALRHAGLHGARLVAWISFLRNAPRACEVLGQDCFPPFGWRRQDQKDKARAAAERWRRARDSPRRVYRGEPADLSMPDDRSEGFARLRGRAEGHACWQPFGTERCSKKGLIFPRTSFC